MQVHVLVICCRKKAWKEAQKQTSNQQITPPSKAQPSSLPLPSCTVEKNCCWSEGLEILLPLFQEFSD
jgi:hypothetical protein